MKSFSGSYKSTVFASPWRPDKWDGEGFSGCGLANNSKKLLPDANICCQRVPVHPRRFLALHRAQFERAHLSINCAALHPQPLKWVHLFAKSVHHHHGVVFSQLNSPHPLVCHKCSINHGERPFSRCTLAHVEGTVWSLRGWACVQRHQWHQMMTTVGQHT